MASLRLPMSSGGVVRCPPSSDRVPPQLRPWRHVVAVGRGKGSRISRLRCIAQRSKEGSPAPAPAPVMEPPLAEVEASAEGAEIGEVQAPAQVEAMDSGGAQVPALVEATDIGKAQASALVEATEIGEAQGPMLVEATEMGEAQALALVEGTEIGETQAPVLVETTEMGEAQAPMLVTAMEMVEAQSPALVEATEIGEAQDLDDAVLGEKDLEVLKGTIRNSASTTTIIGSAGSEEQAKSIVTRSIVFVTAEAAPYSKTGGLGDVCGSLPIALAARGHRVMVVSPRYLNGASDKKFSGAINIGRRIKVPCFGGEHEVTFFHEHRECVDWVFVDHPSYHRPGNPYGDNNGAFGDNQFRFTLLCYAACEAPLVLELGGYNYGEHCLFIVNDWHAGLVPLLLGAKYRPHGVYRDARSILVIHNLSHQGVEPATTYENLGLAPEWYGALEWVFPNWARAHALDKGEAVNILKGAIVTADRIVTVSQGYAWEVTTVEGGHGLDELLSSRKSVLNGITNGIDVDDWNPATDKCIPFHYSIDDLSGKAQCKAELQKELGLSVRPECPLIGFIGRLDYQKGTDLIMLSLSELLQEDVQFVMLGSGDPETEEWMRLAEATYKERFRGWVGFNVAVSHRITAGCDILLMPSRFEPCGLNQLYAMRYGTIPVVHCTGGLRDTVETFNPFANEGRGQGTGWAFSPLTKERMLWALKLAAQTFREHKTSWEGLMRRGMSRDFTWNTAASLYEQILDWASIDPPYVR